MKEIRFESIINKLDNLNIIDIRDKYLYNLEHIPNAINIPINYLLINPSLYLNKSDTYYIYCNYGINSRKACLELERDGYNVINIIGGYQNFKNIDK